MVSIRMRARRRRFVPQLAGIRPVPDVAQVLIARLADIF
jgi:hypothetical protein